MTHFKSLNDSREMVRGREVVAQVLAEKCRGARKRNVRRFFDFAAYSFGEVNDEAIQYFVSSFSVEGDSQFLWREYTDGGKGLNFGIDAGRIGALPEESAPFYVSQVLYSVQEQKAFLRQLVGAAERAISRYSGRFGFDLQDFRVQNIVALLNANLNHHAIGLKDEAWRGEEEWRLVYSILSGDPPERFDQIKSYPGETPKPHVDIVVRSVNPESLLLPITHVTVGPRFGGSVADVEDVLRQRGYDAVPVRRSLA